MARQPLSSRTPSPTSAPEYRRANGPARGHPPVLLRRAYVRSSFVGNFPRPTQARFPGSDSKNRSTLPALSTPSTLLFFAQLQKAAFGHILSQMLESGATVPLAVRRLPLGLSDVRPATNSDHSDNRPADSAPAAPLFRLGTVQGPVLVSPSITNWPQSRPI